MTWEEYDDSDEMDEVKNPVEARAYALDKLDGTIRGEYKHFFCQTCRMLMPCGCDEVSDYDLATQAKYDAHNAVIDELLSVIERMRGT